jgi:hypothetical protein
MKCFAVPMMWIMLVLATTIFLNSCASSEDQFGNTSSSSAQAVPGEKASGGPDVLPAAGAGAGAKVGW